MNRGISLRFGLSAILRGIAAGSWSPARHSPAEPVMDRDRFAALGAGRSVSTGTWRELRLRTRVGCHVHLHADLRRGVWASTASALLHRLRQRGRGRARGRRNLSTRAGGARPSSPRCSSRGRSRGHDRDALLVQAQWPCQSCRFSSGRFFGGRGHGFLYRAGGAPDGRHPGGPGGGVVGIFSQSSCWQRAGVHRLGYVAHAWDTASCGAR